LINMED